MGFVLGFGFLYYWSLLGAWFIVFDELTNQKGKDIGLAYYHYLDVLFPVHADSTYLVVIHFYALFILTIQFTVLFFVRKSATKKINEENTPKVINHAWLILICVLSTLLSLSIIFKEILLAAQFNQSVYYITRHYHGSCFTIHQLLNQVSVSALFLGLTTFLSGDKALFLKGSTHKKYAIYYLLAIFFIEGFLLFIGNKREIFFGGILGILFYLQNVNYKINYKSLAMFITIILIPLFFNDGLRSYSPKFLAEIFDLTTLEFHPKEEIVYTQFTAKNTTFRFLFSNEMFVPHFSMYGVLSHNVPYTYGTSIVSFISSFIPHFLWPDRPAGIYEYYAAQVNAKPGTGYTIHHATAWFLNFGIFGIIIGGFILGWIWSFFYNAIFKVNQFKSSFISILFIIGFSAFTAQIPSMIRSGPEGYKALIFEAILLPVLIIFISTLIPKVLMKNK
ncbi:MAG: hypothetical protein COX70_05350 [Flavobacteriales bacterium CG_4_10_14_0_2_um_filter_32_8]|nr:MAG: hypothetical protein COX70_05350 [Flavobacteriales bacterium CG_4_10_14_0_2_um_filter_32_8]